MFDGLSFMQSTRAMKFDGGDLIVSRLGYTGEDGFEVSVPNDKVENFVSKLCAIDDSGKNPEMVGLGARDSLRLESGLCLYGHDINEDVSPIEAALQWTVSKRRQAEGGFIGYEHVKNHMANGVSKKRCGFIAEGRLPVREGAEIFKDGQKVGIVTSGGPAPSLDNQGIGMAYVDVPHNKLRTELVAVVRNKEIKI